MTSNIIKAVTVLLVLGFFLAIVPLDGKTKPGFSYPVTKKVNQVDNYFGTNVEDPYRWLEDAANPDLKPWLEAQQTYTRKYLDAIPFRANLKKRMTELWNYEKYSSPVWQGEYLVFEKNNGLQEQNITYFQKGLDGKPEVLLDPNTLSTDGSVSLMSMNFSSDSKYIAYGISRSGSDWREFYVMEFPSLKKLDDHVEWGKFTSISWYKNGFFYSRYEKPEENEKLKASLQTHTIYYHKVNTPQSEDKLIFTDTKNPKSIIDAAVSENEKYLVIYSYEGSSDYNRLYYKNMETDSPIAPVIDKSLGHFYFIQEYEGSFYISTDYNAPNFKVIKIDPTKPEEENWQTIVPESEFKLEEYATAGGKLFLSYLKDANKTYSVFDLNGKKLYDVDLPGIGSVNGFGGKVTDKEVFYSFTSFNVPTTHYRYNIAENKSTLFKKPGIKFNPDLFEVQEVFYESKDKTRVPMFLVHKKGLRLDGQNPTLLYAYGGFNSSSTPSFRISMIPFFEAGGVYALACIRGGGEYGEKWHKAGMLERKQNVFDDFIAAAEYLIAKKYTSPAKLAVSGGSNGGLLVGAVINQRPELFKVAIPEVGVMDMLRFHKFTIGWAWTGEYGSSDNPDQFKFLYAYSPLHNIKEGLNYPATLVFTADHDDRVYPAHSFKYIATLQEKYKGTNPVLMNVETKAGHGTGSGTSKTIEGRVDFYSFILYNMNISPTFK